LHGDDLRDRTDRSTRVRLKLLDDGIGNTKVSCDGLWQERRRQELSGGIVYGRQLANLHLAVELQKAFVLSHILVILI
jgi:hypothetical protein